MKTKLLFRKNILPEIFLLILAIFLLFCNLGSIPFERWDEQTNVNVINDSLASDNPLILKLGDELFAEKPPLWYYLNYPIVRVFSSNVFSYRLLSAVSGLAIIIIIYKLCRQYYGINSARVAVLFMFSIGLIFINRPAGLFATHTFRSADLDALQVLFILSSVYLGLRKNGKYIYLAFAVAALGLLTKGFLALLPIVILSILGLKSQEINKKQLIKAIGLIGVIILPWHLLVFIVGGKDYFETYISYHLVQRAITPLEGHSEHIFYYLDLLSYPSVFIGFIPTIVAVVRLFFFSKIANDKLFKLAFGCSVAILLIFTIVSTKLSWYVIPIFPFSAIIYAKWFEAERNCLLKILSMLVIVAGIIINMHYVLNL